MMTEPDPQTVVPEPKPTESRTEQLRRALKNLLDNTPPDATPRSLRQQAEAALAGAD